MSPLARRRALPCGFTLVELLIVLVIVSLLGVMSYRGLVSVLDARDHVRRESEKWRNLASFFAQFERDIRLAAPRSVRQGSGTAPAWYGRPTAPGSQLEFSRFAAAEGVDVARRLTYRLNENQEIELWLWPGLDVAPGPEPERHAVLTGVTRFELDYLDVDLAWANAWPVSGPDTSIPRAVRLRIVLASGEEIVRVFSLPA
jgi:general secretion pathway protein J